MDIGQVKKINGRCGVHTVGALQNNGHDGSW